MRWPSLTHERLMVEAVHVYGTVSRYREELEEPLDWNRLYSLSWLYALTRSMYPKKEKKDELYSSLKNVVLELLGDEKKFKIVIYDHEGAVGILFSLYHVANVEGVPDWVSNRVLEAVERLRWHDFDGEVMAFSYMLANKVGAKEYTGKLIEYISNYLDSWFRRLDYESQRNIIYVLFGFAFILDERLVDIIKKYKLYSIDSYLLQRIMSAYDVELIALILYVFGRLAYSKKLRKRIEKEVIKEIRYRVIPLIGNVLTGKSLRREFY